MEGFPQLLVCSVIQSKGDDFPSHIVSHIKLHLLQAASFSNKHLGSVICHTDGIRFPQNHFPAFRGMGIFNYPGRPDEKKYYQAYGHDHILNSLADFYFLIHVSYYPLTIIIPSPRKAFGELSYFSLFTIAYFHLAYN